MIDLPLRSTVSAPSGTGVVSRAPALSMRPSRTTTTESATGGAPVASISCAPTSATAPAPSGGGGLAAAGERQSQSRRQQMKSFHR